MLTIALITYGVIVVLTVLEHQWWGREPELIRRGLGITSVLMVTAIPLYIFGYFWGWVLITTSFFVAGAVLALFKTRENEAEHQRKLSGVIDERFPTKGNH